MKLVYEMRDNDNLQTYTYNYVEMTGKYTYLCDSMGYPIPYSTQYSAPTSMQEYYVDRTGSETADSWGIAQLPQSEPNGLFPPASADGTWVMCLGPDNKPHASYEEPKLSTFQWKLPEYMLQYVPPGYDKL